MKKTYFVSQRFFLQFTSTSSSVCFHCVVVLLSKSCPVVLSSLVSLVGNHLVSSDNSSKTTSSKNYCMSSNSIFLSPLSFGFSASESLSSLSVSLSESSDFSSSDLSASLINSSAFLSSPSETSTPSSAC